MMTPEEIKELGKAAGELAKPINTLIEKLATGAGVLYEPRKIREKARAEADAALIAARADNEIAGLRDRAFYRVIQTETRNQQNIEAIVDKALPEISAEADPSILGDDWVANFFSKCKEFSDREMQQLWARLLAGEVNKPVTFSRKTINLLGEMTKEDANEFTLLCSFTVNSLETPLIYYNAFPRRVVAGPPRVYLANGVNEFLLRHLDSLGLIHFNPSGEFQKPVMVDPIYFGKSVMLKTNLQFYVGNVVFTQAGTELAKLVTPSEIPGFFDFLKQWWKDVIED